MDGSNAPDGSSSKGSTRAEIMAATRRALANHGVTDLTTHKIADEWGKSQSLLHYYFDTKEDLLVSFIEHLRAESKAAYREQASDPPLDRLWWFLDRDLHGEVTADQRAFSTALLELHSKAAHNENYREALNRYEDDAREFLETTIRDGIKAGTFRDVDPKETAVVLLSAHDGGILRACILGRTDDATAARTGLETVVRSVLLIENEGLDERTATDRDP